MKKILFTILLVLASLSSFAYDFKQGAFVDFSVTLDSVYQTKMGEDVQNRKNELFRFDDFETDLSKYVD